MDNAETGPCIAGKLSHVDATFHINGEKTEYSIHAFQAVV